jgi:hypothetical protein
MRATVFVIAHVLMPDAECPCFLGFPDGGSMAELGRGQTAVTRRSEEAEFLGQ